MTRAKQGETRLANWAIWKRSGGGGAAADEAAVTDAAVACLPDKLKATVLEVYLHDGNTADHCRRLGCPEATISRRLGRADRMLVEHLRAGAERDQLERERALMRSRCPAPS